MAYTIVFFGTKPYDEASFNDKSKEFGFEFRYYKGHLNKNNVLLMQGVDVVHIFANDMADAEVIHAMAANGAKLLVLRCAGFNNVDLNVAATVGITAVRVPVYLPYAVAEYTVTLMFSLNRKIPCASRRTRDGNFSFHGLMGFDMYDKMTGTIGTGKITKTLVHILKGFGMNILAYDLYPDYNFAGEEQIIYTSLDELYHSSNTISLYCPLTEATRYLINDYSVSKMKDGAVAINTDYGQLIHINALIEGLKNKKIGSVGLGVYEEESEYSYRDQPDRIIDDNVPVRLPSFNNVTVTSHQASFTREAMGNIAMTTFRNIRDFINHKSLLNEVKRQNLYLTSLVIEVYKQLEKEKIMKKVIHKADTRGHSQYDWLGSYHTSSFDGYFDSDCINLGALRVLNDDKVAPGEGFQAHPHKNMETISIPLKGHLQHGDSKKNGRIITAGEIQMISAGTGIFHSEVNASSVEPVKFLQVWITPRERNAHPIYKDFSIKELKRPNELAVIVSPDGSAPASLLQDTQFSIGKVEAGEKLGYHLYQNHDGVYIFLIEGEIVVDGEILKRRDGMGVCDTKSFELETLKDSHILLIKVSMQKFGIRNRES